MVTRSRQWAVGMAAVVLVAARPVAAWETLLPWDPWDDGDIFTRGLHVDSAGRTVVTSTLDRGDVSQIAVASIARRNGAVRWSYRHAAGESWLSESLIDARGDVILAGSDATAQSAPRVRILKLDGRTGAIKWRPDLGLGSARAVTADKRGDLVFYVSDYETQRRRLIKLSGANGQLLWESRDDGEGGWYQSIVTDRASNVLLHDSRRISKYDGSTGEELWTHVSSASGAGAVGVAVLPGGDVITQDCSWDRAAQAFATQVVRRSGRDGGERWRWSHAEGPSGYCSSRVRVSPQSDVLVAGRRDVGTEERFTVIRLDGATGVEHWRWDGPRVMHFPSIPIDLAIGTGSDVVVLTDRIATRLSARTGRARSTATIDGLWSGGLVAVRKDGTAVVAGHGDGDGGSGLLVVTVRGGSSARGPRNAGQ